LPIRLYEIYNCCQVELIKSVKLNKSIFLEKKTETNLLSLFLIVFERIGVRTQKSRHRCFRFQTIELEFKVLIEKYRNLKKNLINEDFSNCYIVFSSLFSAIFLSCFSVAMALRELIFWLMLHWYPNITR
jgi:hypothetical protein